MKTTTSLVYKAVRPNGTSIYVPVGLGGRRYEIGKRYRFRKERPTFVFVNRRDDLRSIYYDRPESGVTNRVLICLTKSLQQRAVYGWSIWHEQPRYAFLGVYNVCTDLLVIGEIFVPKRPDCDTPRITTRRILRQRFASKYDMLADRYNIDTIK